MTEENQRSAFTAASAPPALSQASESRRRLDLPRGFALDLTCGPVAWGGGRWPNQDWLASGLIWVGHEGERIVWRHVIQPDSGYLVIAGDADPAHDATWASAVLGVDRRCEPFADPVIERLRDQFAGLRPFSAGSLFDGLVSSIVGQSISVKAAAVTEQRLATLFHPASELLGRRFWPPPLAAQLADATPALLRTTGVTWRRAEALVAAGRAALTDDWPTPARAITDPDHTRRFLRNLPLVGPWTAESALLWGIGLDDAHPTGDVALLRAARQVYADPALDLRGLDRRADAWRPARAWAARLLWTALLGSA